MKRIFTLLFASLALWANGQTVEEILAKHEAAAGGKDKLQAIKTLEVFGSVKISVMNQQMEISATTVKEKGKLYRKQVGGVMGMGDSYTLVTDTAGFVFIPAMRMFGMGGGPGGPGGPAPGTEASVNRMPAEELALLQYELDCAGAFPELINTAAKGHTAELVGTEKVNKQPCFKIKVTLKNGQQQVYYINSETYLVSRVEATGEMAANLTGFGSMMKAFGRNVSKNMKGSMDVLEYQDFGGIKYPLNSKISLASLSATIEYTTVKFNEGLDEKWYKVGG